MESVITNSIPINQWSYDDQPREKLIIKGASVLSNSELLSILINTGNRDSSALDLARDILGAAKNNLNELGKLSLHDLQKIKGIGKAKSTVIAACLELGRRREISIPVDKVRVTKSSEIANYLKVQLKDFSYEVFAVMFMNRSNKINNFEIISRGGITGTVADPRIILKKALEYNAVSIILSHNHPSGNLKPSFADGQLTQKIKEAASYFDIKVIDHIIVSDEGYYSFADDGVL